MALIAEKNVCLIHDFLNFFSIGNAGKTSTMRSREKGDPRFQPLHYNKQNALKNLMAQDRSGSRQRSNRYEKNIDSHLRSFTPSRSSDRKPYVSRAHSNPPLTERHHRSNELYYNYHSFMRSQRAASDLDVSIKPQQDFLERPYNSLNGQPPPAPKSLRSSSSKEYRRDDYKVLPRNKCSNNRDQAYSIERNNGGPTKHNQQVHRTSREYVLENPISNSKGNLSTKVSPRFSNMSKTPNASEQFSSVTTRSTTVKKVALHKPFCTRRLEPFEKIKPEWNFSVLPDGNVRSAYLTKNNYNGSFAICEIMIISYDGMIISIYKSKEHLNTNKIESFLKNCDPPQNYSHSTLPAKYAKKYNKLAEFIQFLQSRTPKIVRYSDLARCTLMETLKDFEAVFYNTGDIIELNDQQHILKYFASDTIEQLPTSQPQNPIIMEMYSHALEWKEKCLQLEKQLCLWEEQSGDPVFPSINGKRRPIKSKKRKDNNKNVNKNKENEPPCVSITNSITSTTNSNRKLSKRTPLGNYNSQNEMKAMREKKFFPSYDVIKNDRYFELRFDDNTLIHVDDANTITYTDYKGTRVLDKYDKSTISLDMQQKLQCLAQYT